MAHSPHTAAKKPRERERDKSLALFLPPTTNLTPELQSTPDPSSSKAVIACGLSTTLSLYRSEILFQGWHLLLCISLCLQRYSSLTHAAFLQLNMESQHARSIKDKKINVAQLFEMPLYYHQIMNPDDSTTICGCKTERAFSCCHCCQSEWFVVG